MAEAVAALRQAPVPTTWLKGCSTTPSISTRSTTTPAPWRWSPRPASSRNDCRPLPFLTAPTGWWHAPINPRKLPGNPAFELDGLDGDRTRWQFRAIRFGNQPRATEQTALYGLDAVASSEAQERTRKNVSTTQRYSGAGGAGSSPAGDAMPFVTLRTLEPESDLFDALDQVVERVGIPNRTPACWPTPAQMAFI